jgi:hypothetical protein
MHAVQRPVSLLSIGGFYRCRVVLETRVRLVAKSCVHIEVQ